MAGANEVELIHVDANETQLINVDELYREENTQPFRATTTRICNGYQLTFPEGKSPYSAYPFGLHDIRPLPWKITLLNEVMTIFSRHCTGQADTEAMHLVFAGPVRWTGKKTEIELNPTAKDRTTGCGCTNSEFFWLPVAMFVEKSKNRRKPV